MLKITEKKYVKSSELMSEKEEEFLTLTDATSRPACRPPWMFTLKQLHTKTRAALLTVQAGHRAMPPALTLLTGHRSSRVELRSVGVACC